MAYKAATKINNGRFIFNTDIQGVINGEVVNNSDIHAQNNGTVNTHGREILTLVTTEGGLDYKLLANEAFGCSYVGGMVGYIQGDMDHFAGKGKVA